MLQNSVANNVADVVGCIPAACFSMLWSDISIYTDQFQTGQFSSDSFSTLCEYVECSVERSVFSETHRRKRYGR